MNIWLINHYAVPPMYYPLARQTIFAKHLMAMGHQVTIIAASTVHNSDMNLITDSSRWREETVDGVHYVYIKCMDYNGNGLKRIYNICEFAWKLPSVCRKLKKPDAIVATSMPPTSCAMGVRLARKYGCRGIAEIADLWPESLIVYGVAGPRHPAVIVLRWLEKWIYKKADAVVFTMEGAYDYILQQGWDKEIPRSKVRFINNGVDLEQFRYNREHFTVDDPDLNDPDTFKVVYAGSIRKANDIGMLLDVAKEVTDPKVRFLIWGAGDEVEMLRQRLVDENITNVVFKGRVEKKYIPYITGKADLNYLDPFTDAIARYGISSNKLFEYFAAGKPILMGFEGNYNPAAPYGCAVICPPDAASLLQGLQQVLALSEQDYAQMCQGAQQAAEHYSFAHLTQMLADTIEKRD
ncbi:MAG: glycosyltransferase family 4 protein [Oscillospiraceae bacterium]|nr:glycosyltransferase family 4 protein [Oscillospiraceae bacterium]